MKRAAPAKEPARQNHTTASNYRPSRGIDALLSRLDRVRQTGPGRWVASCPTRRDRNPSLTIRALDDGRILLHDFGGSSAQEILDAIGLDWSALFPARTNHQARPDRRPFPASDVLRAIGFEGLVVMAAGAALLSGQPFSQADRDRLGVAVGRIQAALDAAGVRRG